MLMAPSIWHFLIFSLGVTLLAVVLGSRDLKQRKTAVIAREETLTRLDSNESALRDKARKRIASDKGMLFEHDALAENEKVNTHLLGSKEPDTILSVDAPRREGAEPNEDSDV